MDFISHFQWIDIFYLIAFLRISYIASSRGLLNETIKIIGVGCAVFFSLQYYPVLFGGLFKEGPFSFFYKYTHFVAFVIIFALTLVIFFLIRKIGSVLFASEMYPRWQRWVGFALGLLRAGLLVSVSFFLIYLWPGCKPGGVGGFFQRYFKNIAPAFYLKVFPLYQNINGSLEINEEVKNYYETEGYLPERDKKRDRG